MKHIGVIGGGQLALMMGTAAQKLGVKLIVQTPNANDPAVSIASDTIFAAVDDATATAKLAKKCDVITFENEFIDIEGLSQLATEKVCFRPRIEALSPLLDKYHQRCFLQDLDIPVPKFKLPESLFTASTVQGEQYTKNHDSQEWELQFPAVLKSSRHGYDGQGTFIIGDLISLEEKLYQDNPDKNQTNNLIESHFLLEEFIPFQKELSVIAARSTSGEILLGASDGVLISNTSQRQSEINSSEASRIFSGDQIQYDPTTNSPEKLSPQVGHESSFVLHSGQISSGTDIEIRANDQSQLLITGDLSADHGFGQIFLRVDSGRIDLNGDATLAGTLRTSGSFQTLLVEGNEADTPATKSPSIGQFPSLRKTGQRGSGSKRTQAVRVYQGAPVTASAQANRTSHQQQSKTNKTNQQPRRSLAQRSGFFGLRGTRDARDKQ